MAPSFHTADRQTYRRVVTMVVLFCAAFVTISLKLRPQSTETRVLMKANRLVHTASDQASAD